MIRELFWRCLAFFFMAALWVAPLVAGVPMDDIRRGFVAVSGLMCWGIADILRVIRGRS